jgi:Zn-dependent protease with chaperone function
VVSDGLLDTLTAKQLDAVLRHEVAHLRRGHHRCLVVAAVVDHAFASFPPTRRSTATLRLALERSADEEAASTCGDRGVVREALGAVTASLVAGPALAAFSAAETIGEGLHAFDDDPSHPPGSHPTCCCTARGAVLGAVALLAVWSWGTCASAVLFMAGTCFS